jgi:ankyrin repeat protein
MEILKLFEPYELINRNQRQFSGLYPSHALAGCPPDSMEDCMRYCIELGMDFSVRNPITGQNPLIYGACMGNIKFVEQLLKNKEKLKLDLNVKDLKGFTAVSIAAAFNHEPCREFLLRNGANDSKQPLLPFDPALSEKSDDIIDVDEMYIQN